MAARLRPATEPAKHTTGAAVRRRDRAHAREGWATSGIRSGLLAKHYGCSPARARSIRTRDPRGPFTTVCAMLADPSISDEDAGKMLAGLLCSYEERFLCRPTEELRARLKRLREEDEHRLQAEQDRALMVRCPETLVTACLQHAGALIEIAVHKDLLEGTPERAN